MVCCMLVAALLGAAWWPARRRGAALAWRPHAVEARPAPSRSAAALAARLRSFRYAAAGLAFLVRREPNARIHALMTGLAVAAGLALGISAADWRWIALAVALVWAAEALNTAVEQVCDLVSPGPNPIVKSAKDVAAGAVLVCALCAATIGVLTLGPYLGGSLPAHAHAHCAP